MADTYSCILFHVIFSTKHRLPTISPLWRHHLYGYLGGIIGNRDCVLLRAGGVENHIHLLVSAATVTTPCNLVRDIKSDSSKWVHDTYPEMRNFYWQTGGGIFTVSPSQKPTLQRYIDNQEEHHKKMTFEEEFLGLLKLHGVKYDERYVFD